MKPSEPQGPPPSARILQLVTAGWLAQAVSVAAALGIADELAEGPRPVDQIAKAVDAHPPTLYRLLRVCADAGLLTELDGQLFALTETGEALRTNGPGSMRHFAMWTGLAAERQTWRGRSGPGSRPSPPCTATRSSSTWVPTRTC
jgi:DNA-binding transcriptional ArsR family regulator